jgi:branched-subunit amino acid ABC-type transport system permease component
MIAPLEWRAPSHESLFFSRALSMTLTMFTLNAFYGLALAMNMFIIASGLNLIFGVLRVINFAHGMFYMFGAYITFTVAKTWGAPFFVGVLAAAVALGLIAFVVERLLLRHLYDKEHLMQLLFTFALVPGMDATIINECFIIVIIGGLGNMWGSFLGALAFGFVVQFGTVLAPNWQDVLPYLLMLAVLIVRPWGLLGRPETGH